MWSKTPGMLSRIHADRVSGADKVVVERAVMLAAAFTNPITSPVWGRWYACSAGNCLVGQQTSLRLKNDQSVPPS